MSKEAYKHLEAAALDAHRRGLTWGQFHAEHGDAVAKAEPINRQRFRRLTDRLLHLLVAGDMDGMTPVGDDAPWERDDRLGEVDDAATHARLQPGALFDASPLYE